MIFYFGDFVD